MSESGSCSASDSGGEDTRACRVFAGRGIGGGAEEDATEGKEKSGSPLASSARNREARGPSSPFPPTSDPFSNSLRLLLQKLWIEVVHQHALYHAVNVDTAGSPSRQTARQITSRRVERNSKHVGYWVVAGAGRCVYMTLIFF
jgi:hypothetical protein